jgi:hypothetical protein
VDGVFSRRFVQGHTPGGLAQSFAAGPVGEYLCRSHCPRGADVPELEEKLAARTVEDFLERFDHTYLDLLYYAALPLILTPELLHYFRHQFTPSLPWVAEVDILLAQDICRERTFEQYTMHAEIRNYLLANARGRIRLREAALVLIRYLREAEHTSVSAPYRCAESSVGGDGLSRRTPP